MVTVTLMTVSIHCLSSVLHVMLELPRHIASMKQSINSRCVLFHNPWMLLLYDDASAMGLSSGELIVVSLVVPTSNTVIMIYHYF